MDINNANEFTSNFNLNNNNNIKVIDEVKVEPAGKINLGILNANLSIKKQESSLVSANALGNNEEEEFLKNLDKDILKSLQNELINEVSNNENKSIGVNKSLAVADIFGANKSAKSKLDEDDEDFDFI